MSERLIRQSKADGGIEIICTRCGTLSPNLKEYVLHKKSAHHVRIVDSIESLRLTGMDDPSFDLLLKDHPNEKVHPEYRKEALAQLKSYMREFTK